MSLCLPHVYPKEGVGSPRVKVTDSFVSCLMRVLGTEPRSSVITGRAFKLLSQLSGPMYLLMLMRF